MMTFRLKTMLIAIGLFGVALSVLLATPSFVAVPMLVLISVTLAAAFATGLAYGNANVRAFCIGALFPTGGTVIGYVWLLCAWFIIGPYQIQDMSKLLAHFDGLSFTFRMWNGACWVIMLIIGLVTLGVKTAVQQSATRRDESRQ